ncbi:MAG: hypothetical protein K9K79_05190 [Desulfohalobiaceae bacterium]|nr:hypothetical protein [Desulfohalobiaceae bacterium]
MSEYEDREIGCYTEHGVSGYGVAAKLSRSEPMTEVDLKSMAEKMVLSIAERCMDLGAKCIGHIKTHLHTPAGTLKVDTIDIARGAYSKGHLSGPVREIYLAVNSIVQGIYEDAVKSATLEGMHEVAEEYGVTVVKEKEHTYFDEFDFVASKQDYTRQLKEQLDQKGGDDSEK